MTENDVCVGARRPNWYREADCLVAEFARMLDSASPGVKPRFAAAVRQRIPIYECAGLQGLLTEPAHRAQLLAEWAQVLLDGAGVFVLEAAFGDTTVVDHATAIFESIIRKERDAGGGGADHFAKAGANARIWNAHEKLCMEAPEVFSRYYANPVLAAAAEAWLGPFYQMTAQVNVVRPGGEAQKAHRDYHLGFLTVDQAQRYPAHVHTMSPFLTLQGAVAHTDMPVESGPTKLLPYSQRYAQGYVAWRRDDFRDYFESHYVQLPLAKGDAVFFNPAVFHAAGSNRTTDVQRMANLLQVSSAYGRAMESLNRTAMCTAVYPVVRTMKADGRLTEAELQSVIASCAEGYPFPTNLDRNPPVGGLAPSSQQDLFRLALDEAWPSGKFEDALRTFAALERTD